MAKNTTNPISIIGQTVVISISGHRDCVDRPLITERLRQRLREIMEGYWLREKNSNGQLNKKDIDTSGIRWFFLSPLALGADQIAADVALELGMELIVPLPMPEECYQEDFSESDWLHVQEILNKAYGKIEIPMLHEISIISTKSQNGNYTDQRNDQYAALGAFLYHYSDIMIFLWDGLENNEKGGTAFVKGYALGDEVCAFDIPYRKPLLQFHPEKILWHLPVKRKKNSSINIEGLHKWKLLEKTNAKSIGGRDESATLNWIRTSQKILSAHAPSAIDILESKKNFLKEDVKNFLSEDTKKATAQQILESYASADVAANRLQKSYERVRFAILGSVGLSVLSFSVFTGFPLDRLKMWEHLPAWSYVTSLALAGAFYVFKKGYFGRFFEIGREIDIQELAHEERILAEALRVQFFVFQAGCKSFVGDYFPGRSSEQLGWILRLLRWEHLQYLMSLDGNSVSNFDSIRTRWLKAQEEYFTRKAAMYQRRVRDYNRVCIGFLLLSFLGSIAYLGNPFGSESLRVALLLFFVGLTPAIAGFVKLWSIAQGNERNFDEYSRMRDVFSRAGKRWEKCNDDGKRKIVQELAREAITETSHWLNYFKKEEPKPTPL